MQIQWIYMVTKTYCAPKSIKVFEWSHREIYEMPSGSWFPFHYLTNGSVWTGESCLTSVTLFPPASVKRLLSIMSLTVGFVVVTVYEQIKIICQMSQGFFFESHILLSDISQKYEQNEKSSVQIQWGFSHHIKHTHILHTHTHSQTSERDFSSLNTDWPVWHLNQQENYPPSAWIKRFFHYTTLNCTLHSTDHFRYQVRPMQKDIMFSC